jgi:hypothetical protein
MEAERASGRWTEQGRWASGRRTEGPQDEGARILAAWPWAPVTSSEVTDRFAKAVEPKGLVEAQVVAALAALAVFAIGVLVTARAGASSPITLVQESSNAVVGSTSMTLTLASPVQAGDALIATFNNTHDALTVTSVSGGGVTWHLANSYDDHLTADSEIWYGLDAPAGSATVTVNLSGTATGAPQTIAGWGDYRRGSQTFGPARPDSC